MFYERLKQLCEERGVALTNVVKELGMSTGNLSKWSSGKIPTFLPCVADCTKPDCPLRISPRRLKPGLLLKLW